MAELIKNGYKMCGQRLNEEIDTMIDEIHKAYMNHTNELAKARLDAQMKILWCFKDKNENAIADGMSLPTTTESEIRAKAKRELAEQIEKRLKEEVALLEAEREEAREYDDEQIIFAVSNQLRAFDYSLRVVAEQLKGEQ